jgi:hypothetical protein
MIILSFCEIELRMKRRAEIAELDVIEWFFFLRDRKPILWIGCDLDVDTCDWILLRWVSLR